MTMKKWLMMMVGTLALLMGLATSAVAALSTAEYEEYIKNLREGKLTTAQIAATLSQLSVAQLENLYPAIQDVPAAATSLTTAYADAVIANTLTPDQLVAVWEDLPPAQLAIVYDKVEDTPEAAARLVVVVTNEKGETAGQAVFSGFSPETRASVETEIVKVESGTVVIGGETVPVPSTITDNVVDPAKDLPISPARPA